MNRTAFSPDASRPASSCSDQLATLQEDFGKVQAVATQAIADGNLTHLERSHMTIRLRGLMGRVAELLEVLR